MTKTPLNIDNSKTSSIELSEIQKHNAHDYWKSNPEIIKIFLEIENDYKQLCTEVEYILRKKIEQSGIETASISSRPKTLNSFLEKLRRKQYDKPFEEVTDFAGVRVVCLYQADTQKISEIIRSEFKILEDIDKLNKLEANQFGYGAHHFLVYLGKSSSGARYDDLKQLICEIQVRTVVQDAWSILQNHMVYKRESQVPTQLQRKLNSLAALFETVDDQFEMIRERRDQYLETIRESAKSPNFLENELNFDSFKEYLNQEFPNRPLENWEGQALMVLDSLKSAGYSTLNDVHTMLQQTKEERKLLIEESGSLFLRDSDGMVSANIEPALALALTEKDWNSLMPWGKAEEAIKNFLKKRKS